MNEGSKFQAAIDLIDGENSLDPHKEPDQGGEYPRELLYSKRLTRWVKQLAPNASQELLLAARGQHICRWMHPRDSYPMNRAGYLKWREGLKTFHAGKVAGILKEAGYGDEFIFRVRELIIKKNLSGHPDGRILEDALNLVFLQFQFSEFLEKKGEEKTLEVLRKTWLKISPQGRKEALTIPYKDKEMSLIQKALGS